MTAACWTLVTMSVFTRNSAISWSFWPWIWFNKSKLISWIGKFPLTGMHTAICSRCVVCNWASAASARCRSCSSRLRRFWSTASAFVLRFPVRRITIELWPVAHHHYSTHMCSCIVLTSFASALERPWADSCASALYRESCSSAALAASVRIYCVDSKQLYYPYI